MSQKSELRAGAARVGITPEMGIQLAGDIGRKRPAEEIRERLHANALAVERIRLRRSVLELPLRELSAERNSRP